jgi:hypothetical protein
MSDHKDLNWPIRERRKFGGRVHLAAISFGGIAWLLDLLFFPGWAGPIVIGVGVIGGSVLVLQRFWHKASFWVTLAVLAALQVPMMIFARSVTDHFNPFFVFGAALLDFFLVALILNLVCGE